MYKTKRLNQVGDTIVEVLIAVVVVGMAIGLGYGVASRSLKANRQSQERGEALKQVESQVERLKKLATTDTGGPSGVFRSGSYCITGDANEIKSADNALCTVNDRYNLSITLQDPASSTTTQFNITARWEGLTGKPEETTIIYRIYPATAT